MGILSTICRSFGAYLSPRKDGGNEAHTTTREADLHESDLSSLRGGDLQNLEGEGRAHTGPVDFEGDTLPLCSGTNKKRRVPAWPLRGTAKKRKIYDDDHKREYDDSDFEGSTLLTSTPATRKKAVTRKAKAGADRELMPPPAAPIGMNQRRGSFQSGTEDETSDIGLVAPASANRRKVNEIDEFDIELSRRNTEVVSLPANSGVWAEAEKDLFYHLALRGFEPLLPENWMLDFKTLPLSLYAREGTPQPLISSHAEAEFRAIRALRDLIGLGQQVRDHAISIRRSQPEPTIERGIQKYMSWALRDVGMHPTQRPSAIPVHAITAMRRDQTTQDTIAELTANLHVLASRWRRAHNICESVEAPSITPISNEETQIAVGDSDDLPILIGIIICSSLLMIVTLNAHTLPPPVLTTKTCPPPHIVSPQSQSSTSSDIVLKKEEGPDPETPNTAVGAEVEDSGLRVIATFDFSDARQDVWNALAVAIVAMCTRKIMVAQFELDSRAGHRSMWETMDQRSPRGTGEGGDDAWDPDV
jgi:hypothetical protein